MKSRKCFHPEKRRIPSGIYCPVCTHARKGYKTNYPGGKPPIWPFIRGFLLEWGIINIRDCMRIFGWPAGTTRVRLSELTRPLGNHPPRLRRIADGVYTFAEGEGQP